jgi:hypothetical protein
MKLSGLICDSQNEATPTGSVKIISALSFAISLDKLSTEITEAPEKWG